MLVEVVVMGILKEVGFIKDLIARAGNLEYQDTTAKDSIIRETEMFIRKVFPDSEYRASLIRIRFTSHSIGASREISIKAWNTGRDKLVNILTTMQKELEFFHDDDLDTEGPGQAEGQPLVSNKVFVVHGHDEAMKLDVARTIEKLGLEAVILHEKENFGLTVIEKFEENALNCTFAVVLLSPDDRGYPVDGNSNASKFRARQNVILELGYFVGMLGRDKVLPLVKNDPAENLEIPSDFAGVVYTPYDMGGAWKTELFRALKSAGYKVDANLMFQ